MTSDGRNVLPYGRGGRPTLLRAVRPALLVVQGVLMAGAFVTFYLALARPASPGDAWHIGARTGWECLIVGFVFWPSNALVLLSPLAAVALWRARGPAPFIVTATLYVASTGWVAFATSDHIALASSLPGYVLWLCSHALASTAVLIPTWRGEGRRTQGHGSTQ